MSETVMEVHFIYMEHQVFDIRTFTRKQEFQEFVRLNIYYYSKQKNTPCFTEPTVWLHDETVMASL